MVGDDEIEAQLARPARGVGAADAAIDRYDQRHAVCVQAIDRRRLQAIAVLQALRDEMHDVGAEQLQRAAQDHRRGHTIDVVVTVDRDALLACNRTQETIDGDAHVGEPPRIVKMIERRVQKPRGELRVAEAALAEEPRDRRRDPQRGGERIGGRFVARGCFPARGNHLLIPLISLMSRRIACFGLTGTQRTPRTQRSDTS